MPEKKEVEEPFEDKFVFLDKKYVQKMRLRSYEPAVFSENFQSMLDDFDVLRVEIGYGRMASTDGFSKAVEIESKHGFESHLNFTDGEIDARWYYKAVLQEMRDLNLRFPPTESSDEHRWSSDTSGMYRDVDRATTSLSLKPIKPVSLDFDAAVDGAITSVVEALNEASKTKGMFTDAANDSRALRRAIEGIAKKAEPQLAEQHKHWDFKVA